MIDVLIILLRPALLCVEGGQWRYAPLAIVAWAVDIIIARTTFRLAVGRGPQNGERTVSDMLENLVNDHSHPDRLLFVEIAKKINRVSPTGRHIKNV